MHIEFVMYRFWAFSIHDTLHMGNFCMFFALDSFVVGKKTNILLMIKPS